MGNKHHLRKSADRKAQIRKAFVPLTELICAFRSAGFLRWCLFPKRNLTKHHLRKSADRKAQGGVYSPRKPRNHESVLKKNILIRNAKKGPHFQSKVVERLGLVCFLEQRDFDDPGIDDLMNGERFQISGTRRDGSTT